MSRVAKQPIEIPDNVEIDIKDKTIFFKGPKGEISMGMNSNVEVKTEDKLIKVEITENNSAIAGTTRALINNNVIGVSKGFEKILNIVGVGYKAELKNKELHLSLGFSHPIVYKYSQDVEIKTPSPTEITINGVDKQKVGQVAAEIRAFRPPEPYKGKGVKYCDEHIIRKEAKKK